MFPIDTNTWLQVFGHASSFKIRNHILGIGFVHHIDTYNLDDSVRVHSSVGETDDDNTIAILGICAQRAISNGSIL